MQYQFDELLVDELTNKKISKLVDMFGHKKDFQVNDTFCSYEDDGGAFVTVGLNTVEL